MTRSWFAVIMIATLALAPICQGRGESVEQLLRMTGSPKTKERSSAAHELSLHQEPRVVEVLARLVRDDPEAKVRLTAVKSLGSYYIRPSGAQVALSFVPFTDKEEFVLPRGTPVDPAVVAGLLPALADSHAGVVKEAASYLGRLHAPEAISGLGSLTDSDDAAVRRAAAEALGRIGSAEAGPALVPYLGDRHPNIRAAAASALGSTGYAPAGDRLKELYTDDRKENVRLGALQSLGHLARAEDQELLLSALGQEKAAFRRAAVEGLARVADPATEATLEKMGATEEDRTVQLALMFAGYRLGEKKALEDLYWTFNELRFRSQAMEYLLELSPGVVPELLPLLEDGDPQRVAYLARILGRIGDARALPTLRTLVDHESVAVRNESRAAIEAIKGSP